MDDITRSARERIERARQHAGGSPWLVGYDVVGIQTYVTANSRPVAMSGASHLISQFDGRCSAEAGCLFGGGGRGLFLAQEAQATRFGPTLQQRFRDATVTGVLATAAVPFDGVHARSSLRRLRLALDAAKDAAPRPPDALPEGKHDQCARCRVHHIVGEVVAGKEVERVCDRCKRITEEGKNRHKHLGIAGLSLADLSTTGYVAALSADGNAMGALFESLDSLEGVVAASLAVSDIFAHAHKAALTACGCGSAYVAPVTGGDDIRVFLAPHFVQAYVSTLAREVEQRGERVGSLGGVLSAAQQGHFARMGVGIGVVAAGDKSSATRLLLRAHELERSAKALCRGPDAPRSAVDFAWVTSEEALLDGSSLRRSARDDRHRVALSGDAWQKAVARARRLEDVPSSQRGVVTERASMAPEEFENLFRYQVARSAKWQGWYDAIGVDWRQRDKVIAEMPTLADLELLRFVSDRRPT